MVSRSSSTRHITNYAREQEAMKTLEAAGGWHQVASSISDPTWLSATPGDGHLGCDLIGSALVTLAPVRRSVDDNELHLIGYARAQGQDWDTIADALGVTPAAARTRWSRLRRDYPAYKAPRVHAAQWAAGHAAELRAAITSILDNRAEALAASPYMSDYVLDRLAGAIALDDDPVRLYWAVWAATRFATDGQVGALRDLVTEPAASKRTRR